MHVCIITNETVNRWFTRILIHTKVSDFKEALCYFFFLLHAYRPLYFLIVQCFLLFCFASEPGESCSDFVKTVCLVNIGTKSNKLWQELCPTPTLHFQYAANAKI